MPFKMRLICAMGIVCDQGVYHKRRHTNSSSISRIILRVVCDLFITFREQAVQRLHYPSLGQWDGQWKRGCQWKWGDCRINHPKMVFNSAPVNAFWKIILNRALNRTLLIQSGLLVALKYRFKIELERSASHWWTADLQVTVCNLQAN